MTTKKKSWSFSGFVIGFIALAATVIIFYYSESKEKFDFKLIIEDEFNLIELKDEISDLQIFYKDENIIESNKEIKVIIYTFSNEGKIILQNYYDNQKPLAIRFNNSRVISSKILSSNSEYLKDDFLINKTDSIDIGVVSFKKLIFEKGKKITLKSYLIQDKGINKTEIVFLGKVAGIDKFTIQIKKEAIETEDKESKSSWNAWWWFLGIYLGIVIIVVVIGSISDSIEHKKFDKKWKEFESKHPEFQNQKEIVEEVKFNSRIKRLIVKLLQGEGEVLLHTYLEQSRPPLLRLFIRPRGYRTLPEKYFKVENHKISLNPQHKKIVMAFFEFNGMEL